MCVCVHIPRKVVLGEVLRTWLFALKQLWFANVEIRAHSLSACKRVLEIPSRVLAC